MYNVNLNVKFRLKTKVYRLADEDKKLCFVVGYYVDVATVMYEIRDNELLFTLYDFEIDLYENKFSNLN